jgi:hypothetical protein
MKFRIIQMADGKYIPQVKRSLLSFWNSVGYGPYNERLFPGYYFYDKKYEYAVCAVSSIEEAALILERFKGEEQRNKERRTISKIIKLEDRI